jgi:hypothetical protein
MPDRPEPAVVSRAVEIFIQHAYGADRPISVRSQLATLSSWKGEFYRCPVIAPDFNKPPRRYTIRLGNRNYPHMKLAIEQTPDDKAFIFRVDTHDRHCCPVPGSPEYQPFLQLMEQNQKLAQEIESAWAAENIPTFKSHLRDDLAKRQQG